MREKNYAKRQVVVSTLILIVLIGILAALGYVAYMLAPALTEATATLENTHKITDSLVEVMPEIKQGLVDDIKAGGASVMNLIKSFTK